MPCTAAIGRSSSTTPAARHIVVVKDDIHSIFRRIRRKRLPLFGNRELFRDIAPYVFRHLLLHHGMLTTLAEPGVIGIRPKLSIVLKSLSQKCTGARLQQRADLKRDAPALTYKSPR